MRNILIAIILFLTPSISLASKEAIEKHIPNAVLVGEGELSKFFWDIYSAELYAPNGKYVEGQPVALKLKYLRSFKKSSIADRTILEIKNQGFSDSQQLEKWRQEMMNSVDDVKSGTIITGIYTKNKETIFYTNDNSGKIINDAEFGQKFFDIWLSPKTSEPKLRKKLLGII